MCATRRQRTRELQIFILLHRHFKAFPREIIDAARIDGASEWRIVYGIVPPASRPAVAALAVFVFISTWNEYVGPLLVASDPSMQILTAGMANFASEEGRARWGLIMAAAVLATAPALLAYFAVRKADPVGGVGRGGQGMNVLFIGDIVGPEATAYVAERVPRLRSEYALDLVIANAENCLVSGSDPLSGFGMSVALIESLLRAGVDVITSGNHAWDGPDAERVLAHPRVLRPGNLLPSRSGKGSLTLDVKGEPVTILNLADRQAIPDALPVYRAWRDARVVGTVIIDFHGGDLTEKMSFAFAVDGVAAAVLGTHTHEPTLTLHRLPGGTAFVADVGMTGPSGGWGGIDPTRPVAQIKGEEPVELAPFTLATGPIVFGAVLLRIADGRTVDLVRLD